MSQNQPKKGNPSLWVVLILVALIAVATILYFGDFFNSNSNSNTNTVANTNTQTNTNVVLNTNSSTDLTYSNSEYKYSFQYPSNLSAQDYTETNSSMYGGRIVSDIIVPVQEGNPYIQVDVVNDSLNNVKTNIENQNSGKTIDWVSTTVDSKTAKKATILFGSDNYYVNYYLVENSESIYVITTYTTGSAQDEIISEFVFLN